MRPCCDLCKISHVVKSQVALIRARDRCSSTCINKIGSREVFDHFHDPAGSALDDSSRCRHVFKSFLVLSQLNKIKMQKIRRKIVARWFLLIGNDRASKKHEMGGTESFEHVQKPATAIQEHR